MPTAAQIAANAHAEKPKGRAHTPSVEELYGALERQGLCRIIRRKGRPPVIKWL